MDFTGAKVAVFFEGKLIMQLRDSKPGLRFSGMWDFPGGGREGDETPIECAIREIREEFGITLNPEQFIWEKKYPAMHDPSLTAYFLVAQASKENIDNIRFGEEGQEWDFMDIETFFLDQNVVPDLKGRLRDYMEAIASK